MPKVLIVGADGLIGSDLVSHFRHSGWSVIGTTRRNPVARGTTIALDLASVDAHNWPLPQVDLAIFAAGIARFADCRERPTLARRVNVEAPVILAQRLAATGTHVVLVSTSAVFDGTRPGVPPSAATSPTTAYGLMKSEAERAFLKLGARGGVARLTKVFGPVNPLIQGWITALRAGHEVRAFTDLRMAPIGLDDVRAGVVAAIAGGVVQVSGACDIRYLDAAIHIGRRLGARPELVCTATAAAIGIPANERPPHTNLDTVWLAKSGWRPPDPLALIDRLYLAPKTLH